MDPVSDQQPDIDNMLTVPENGEVILPQLLPEEAVAVQAFQEIQQAEEVAKAKKAKQPKLNKHEEIEKLLPVGTQLYYDHLTQRPKVGDAVTVKSPKLHDEEGLPISGKYGVGPVVMQTKVKEVECDGPGKCANKVICENEKVLVLRRTGLWELEEDNVIKKPHKRHIIMFRDKFETVSEDVREKIKQLSTKKRKTDREVRAAENKKAKALQKKENAKRKRGKPERAVKSKQQKKAKPEVIKRRKSKPQESEESSDSETEDESRTETESETEEEEVAVEVIVDKLAEKMETIIDEKLDKILGKRKRQPETHSKKSGRPAKKAKKAKK